MLFEFSVSDMLLLSPVLLPLLLLSLPLLLPLLLLLLLPLVAAYAFLVTETRVSCGFFSHIGFSYGSLTRGPFR